MKPRKKKRPTHPAYVVAQATSLKAELAALARTLRQAESCERLLRSMAEPARSDMLAHLCMVGEWIDLSPSMKRYRKHKPTSFGPSLTAYATAAGVLGGHIATTAPRDNVFESLGGGA